MSEPSRTAAVAGSDALPEWLWPLESAAATITAAMLSRYVPEPPGTARASAVLMLFGEQAHGPDLLLIERAHTMRSHPGQLAFPGGATDPTDLDPADTALREAHEEVGVDAGGVDVFGMLPPLWVPPSNFAVTTVLGWWHTPAAVRVVDPVEVASALRVPLRELLDPARRFTVRHPSGWCGPAFEVGDGLLLWGFTAGVVSRLFAHAGWERPWDDTRERPLPGGPL